MTALREAILEVLDDRAALARRAAEWLAGWLGGRDGTLAVALSGGSTPKPVYELLAGSRLPWPRIHWFFGDERFVPQDHPDSNYRMVREALFARAPVPPGNIHPIPTTGAPADAAKAYDEELRRFAQGRAPLFDAVLLGIGPDGHTASLFPGGAALEERARWAVAADHPPGARITLTLPALGQSAAVAFIAAGAEKRPVLARIFAGETPPAARVATAGEMRLFLDRDAAPPR
jgi:6-phosphogluconolactonase